MSESAPEWLTLDEGETVEWVGEPELASRAGELLTGLALLPIAGLGLLVMVPPYLQVKNTDYVVTNQSLYAKSGVFSTNIQSLELDKIQNTEYSQGFVEKQLGYGTVGVDTAGGSDIELEFESIPDSREVQETIRELSKQYREAAATGETGDGEEGAGDIAAVADELERTREALESVEAAISRALEAQRDQGGGEAGGHGQPGQRDGETQQRQHGGSQSVGQGEHTTAQRDAGAHQQDAANQQDVTAHQQDASHQQDDTTGQPPQEGGDGQLGGGGDDDGSVAGGDDDGPFGGDDQDGPFGGDDQDGSDGPFG